MFDKPFANPRIQAQQHTFSKVPHANIPRSSFNRSHGHKTTINSGLLVPVFVDEALPGDTFSLSTTTFARLATQVVPVMDNLYADLHFFAVPYRLVWENWERFNGAQDDPGDSTDFLVPQGTVEAETDPSLLYGTVLDYFGLPIDSPGGFSFNSLPLRAYRLIWNEWYRDQNIQNSISVQKTDGPETLPSQQLLPRGKRHDYFTSCLPWPQKGPAVELPLGTSAPVVGLGLNARGAFTTDVSNRQADRETHISDGWFISDASPVGASQSHIFVERQAGAEDYPAIFADLNNATAATINSLREAFQLQKMFERDARGGTRYTEILRAHFGVVSPDFRLQRPEYLGGGTTNVNISPIPQTSATDETTPQGNLAAMGTFSHSGIGFTKSFTEHCIVLGLLSVRADLNYQQGLHRMWSRQTRYDFYWPALAHLGEQAVLTKELYCTGDPEIDDSVFGYQERWAEYRYKPGQITGLFRSTAAQSLDVWHLAQEFISQPVLNHNFIREQPPMQRVKAVISEPDFMVDMAFHYKCARPMPVYSVPGLIDHF